jgi:hypothetical protein
MLAINVVIYILGGQSENEHFGGVKMNPFVPSAQAPARWQLPIGDFEELRTTAGPNEMTRGQRCQFEGVERIVLRLNGSDPGNQAATTVSRVNGRDAASLRTICIARRKLLRLLHPPTATETVEACGTADEHVTML